MRPLPSPRAAPIMLALVASCASSTGVQPATPAASAPAMFYGQLGGTQSSYPLADLARLVPLAPGEAFKIVELGRDAGASHHAVALLGAEPLHRHDLHDLLVVVLEGEGEMLIGEQSRAIGAHSIVYVPRGEVHSLRNTGKRAVLGYAVFTPPFDGKDRVPVGSP